MRASALEEIPAPSASGQLWGYHNAVTGAATNPLPWQSRFHGAWRSTWGRLAGGAFGAGKSLALVIDALLMCERFPGLKVVFIRKTLKDLRESTQLVLFEDVLGVHSQDARAHPRVDYWNQTTQLLRLRNGSEIWWAGCQDAGSRRAGGARSKTFGYAYFDEITELTEDDFREWIARLRQPGMPCGWAAATNPEPNWVKDRFHPGSRNRQPGVAFFQTRTSQNIHLPPDYAARLREQYPEVWVKRFLDGSWDVFEGQIFTEFDRERHTGVFEAPARPGIWRCFGGMDWGHRNPMAWIAGGLDYDGRLWVFREVYRSGLRPAEASALIKPHQEAHQVAVSALDQSAWNTPQDGGVSVASQLAREGLRLTQGTRDVGGTIMQVKALLEKGRLRIHACCENLLRELPQYRYADLTPGREAYANDPEEPVKKDDHAVDALRYLSYHVLAGGYAEPVQEGPEDLAKRRAERLLREGQRRERMRNGRW